MRPSIMACTQMRPRKASCGDRWGCLEIATSRMCHVGMEDVMLGFSQWDTRIKAVGKYKRQKEGCLSLACPVLP